MGSSYEREYSANLERDDEDPPVDWEAEASHMRGLVVELRDQCEEFLGLYRETDMRPEDECNMLYDRINRLVAKVDLVL